MQTEKHNYLLYKHTSPSGKVYVGITCQRPDDRWRGGKGYSYNDHFFNAIMKYGWENIQHEILAAGLTRAEACTMERALIALYHSDDPACGYNHTTGGDHTSLSPESCHKLSESHRGPRNPNWGKPMSEEQRRKIGDANRGHRHGAEARRKMSEAKRANAPAVRCVETGEVYDCLTDAAAAVGTHKSSISNCCKGRPHYNTAAGFHWEYV